MELFRKIKTRYRYSAIILRQLVVTDFKLRYKGSVLGYLWSLVKPLALFAIIYVVFINFLKFGNGIPHFSVAVLLAMILWSYFTEVTSGAISSIVGRGDLLRKLSFPRYVIVVAGSFSAFINLAINLIVVVVFALINGVTITWDVLWMIPIIGELFVLALGVGFLLSSLYVKFRDINYIWDLVLQVGFYATPIFYPLDMIVEKSVLMAHVMILNPVAQIIQDARAVLISPSDYPSIVGVFGSAWPYLIPVVLVLVIAIGGGFYFRRHSPRFAEEI